MAEGKKGVGTSIVENLGIKRTVIRPPEESEIRLRPDRVGKYFKKYLNKFIFVEFSEEFLASQPKIKDIMMGVPIPLRKRDVKEFAGGEGLKPLHLGENMTWVMGCDPKFKYNEAYVAYLKKLFNYKIYEGMLKEGRDAAEREDYDDACVHFRASLVMQPDYLHGMYSYAKVCRSMYLSSSNQEYVGRFKAEALDYFELLTETHPRFAQGYYYLGYAYLNMGLYSKAFAAWKGFIKFTRNGKDRKEIRNRIQQIQEPIRIEEGYTEIMAGRFQNGVDILEPFLNGKYKDWWPLHYYLGVGYSRTGQNKKAVNQLKRTLEMNGSHIDTMKELVEIYDASDDKTNAAKYRKKIELIERDLAIEAEKTREEEAANERAEEKKEAAEQKSMEMAEAKQLAAEARKREADRAAAMKKAGAKKSGTQKKLPEQPAEVFEQEAHAQPEETTKAGVKRLK